MKKIIFIVCILVCVLYSCNSNGPSICDTIENSYLCEMANKTGIKLESVGNGLIVMNNIAISSGYITSVKYNDILIKIRQSLDEPITYVLFKDKIIKYADKYPKTLSIGKKYVQLFELNKNISESDKMLIKYWIDRQIKKGRILK